MQATYDIAELVQRVRQKDMLAMRILYHQYAKAMLTLSFRITQNKADAEDIIQESFLRSFEQIAKLNEPEKYGGWLKRIVVNNSLRATKTKRHFDPIDQMEDTPEEDQSNWYEGIPFEKIKTAINKLPDGCREIFTLYLLEGYKHKEVAELMQISVSTSKSQYRYALKLMREQLERYRR